MKPTDRKRQYLCVVVLEPSLIAALDEARITVNLVPQGAWTFEPGATLGPTSWTAVASFPHEERALPASPVGQGFAAAPDGAAVAVEVALHRLSFACSAAATGLRADAPRLSRKRQEAARTRAAAHDDEARTAARVADTFGAVARGPL